ncbi:MAG TPA: hypothetical protein PKZ37_16620 [Gallionellaceae bacterium]|jgi:hypothetical protein|nr:hypothetical protein [Gallionellaceae bacterium]
MRDQCTEQRFLEDVARHQMTILRDDGVNRHVRFKQPDSSNMFFDLITWPGCLCYTGDMGTYVFRRLEDMFEFFRTDREYQPNNGQKLFINLGYWSEKLESVSRFGNGYEEFSMDKFKSAVNEYVEQYITEEELPEGSEGEAQALREAVESEVLSCEENSYAAYDASSRFEHEGFGFTDFWERDFTVYTFHFIWCCYALAWGIQQYDSLKDKKATEQEFYLQDSRDYIGNDVLWWADAGGYTTDLNKAEIFTKESAYRQNKMRETDIPWPKSYIDGKSRPAVDMQYIQPTAEMLKAHEVTA